MAKFVKDKCTTANMQYIKLGSRWFFKVRVTHQLSVTVDKNAARTPQLFILQDRYCDTKSYK